MTEETVVNSEVPTVIPVLPLRDVVVYPNMALPLFVGREKSIQALNDAMQASQRILLVAQRDPEMDDPGPFDLYSVGTLSTITQVLKLPDGTVKVLVKGNDRCRLEEIEPAGTHYRARVTMLDETTRADRAEFEGLIRAALGSFEHYARLYEKIPQEVAGSLEQFSHPGTLADAMAAHLPFKLEDKQFLLEVIDPVERLEKLIGFLQTETDLLETGKRIRGRVKEQMDKNQREYFLNEQMKAIRKELGQINETPDEFQELADGIAKARMPKEAKAKADAELEKLRQMPAQSAETTVVRNYLDWMIAMPWKRRSKVAIDLKKAETLLNTEHYGLDKVKERILEYLAVQQRSKTLKGPILCLVGPPGVGKTSLGQSIASATNRKYVRMALGGVRDEAEIRGHRRTYVGAMPGKIMQSLAKIKTRNPLFLLDEIDKMAMDFRGDPASALLEVLDPEQNNSFNDHFLGVDFDLSEVMFLATANTLHIPGPLLDRMETIRLAGYTEDEKIHIASSYLLPKQIRNNGLRTDEIHVTDSALQDMVRYYTREAGVRSLEREIAKICRKVVKNLLLKPSGKKQIITHRSLEEYLGIPRFRYGVAETSDRVGQVTGLAWTEVGGELLTVEAAVLQGTGKHIRTGKLGEVMQESIAAAMTVARVRAAQLGISPNFYQSKDVHIHVPEGATPKDGPSAGIAMCTALVSALTDIPVRADVAMTGEITLRGDVLPIGGLKEKLLAAHRGGIKTVVIPQDNEKDLTEIPKNVKRGLRIVPVRSVDQVLELALQRSPEPLIEAPDLPVDTEADIPALAGRVAAH